YHLVPVALTRGVFHPKCCYLEGPDGDLLAIGSGNLTFGGYGRNLEVLDLLSPEASPDVFREFGGFLNALRRRTDLQCPEPKWMDIFANCAFVAAGNAPSEPDRSAWLVHSVDRPIIDQVKILLEPRGPIERLTVLSPYHDPDGRAIRTLAEETHPHQLAIGLEPLVTPDRLATALSLMADCDLLHWHNTTKGYSASEVIADRA
ncbi:MAG: hypothetical protein M3N93_09500, partial [Acidobacteriota bacterium]|nr:hypothetical protein [Acidobacteriota bacterium]